MSQLLWFGRLTEHIMWRPGGAKQHLKWQWICQASRSSWKTWRTGIRQDRDTEANASKPILGVAGVLVLSVLMKPQQPYLGMGRPSAERRSCCLGLPMHKLECDEDKRFMAASDLTQEVTMSNQVQLIFIRANFFSLQPFLHELCGVVNVWCTIWLPPTVV